MENDKVIEIKDYLIQECRDQSSPYLASLAKGLRGGAIYLRDNADSKLDILTSKIFAEAATGFEEALLRLELKDRLHIRPRKQSFMSSSSLFLGLLFARVEQHLREEKQEK